MTTLQIDLDLEQINDSITAPTVPVNVPSVLNKNDASSNNSQPPNKRLNKRPINVIIPSMPPVPTAPINDDSQKSNNDKTDASNPLSLPDLDEHFEPQRKKRKLNNENVDKPNYNLVGGKRRSSRDYDRINSKYNTDNINQHHYGEELKSSDDETEQHNEQNEDIDLDVDTKNIDLSKDDHHNSKVLKKLVFF